MKKFLLGVAVLMIICLPAAARAQRKQGRSKGRKPGNYARTAPARVEPIRTMRGSLFANKISVRTSDTDQPSFDYTINSVRINERRIELQGTIKPAKANVGEASPVTATLVGTLAKLRPPEPGARAKATGQSTSPAASAASGQNPAQQQGREPTNPENAAQIGELSQATQTTALTTQPPTAPGGKQPAGTFLTEQITEAPVQTQALATATNGVTGCEVMFLKMRLPPQLASTARSGNQSVQLGVSLAPIDNKLGAEINQRICGVVRALNANAKSENIEAELTELNRLLGGRR